MRHTLSHSHLTQSADPSGGLHGRSLRKQYTCTHGLSVAEGLGWILCSQLCFESKVSEQRSQPQCSYYMSLSLTPLPRVSYRIRIFDASLCGVSTSADALRRFFTHSLTQALTYKPRLTGRETYLTAWCGICLMMLFIFTLSLDSFQMGSENSDLWSVSVHHTLRWMLKLTHHFFCPLLINDMLILLCPHKL